MSKNGGKFNWSSAWAGSTSSYLSVGTELFGDGAAAIGGRTLIMAMVGGTTSVITGGKFEDGAVSATFVHLFNGEAKNILLFGADVAKTMDSNEQYNKDFDKLFTQCVNGNSTACDIQAQERNASLNNIQPTIKSGASLAWGTYITMGVSLLGFGIYSFLGF